MRNKIYKFVHFSAYLTIFHGVFYLVVKYFFQIDSPYGARPHFLQGYAQSVHILFSPLFIFAVGLLWKDHILAKYRRSTKKRASGIALFLTSVVVIVSGYGIQAFYQEDLKALQVWAHLVSGCLFILVYGLHHLGKKR